MCTSQDERKRYKECQPLLPPTIYVCTSASVVPCGLGFCLKCLCVKGVVAIGIHSTNAIIFVLIICDDRLGVVCLCTNLMSQ